VRVKRPRKSREGVLWPAMDPDKKRAAEIPLRRPRDARVARDFPAPRRSVA